MCCTAGFTCKAYCNCHIFLVLKLLLSWLCSCLDHSAKFLVHYVGDDEDSNSVLYSLKFMTYPNFVFRQIKLVSTNCFVVLFVLHYRFPLMHCIIFEVTIFFKNPKNFLNGTCHCHVVFTDKARKVSVICMKYQCSPLANPFNQIKFQTGCNIEKTGNVWNGFRIILWLFPA